MLILVVNVTKVCKVKFENCASALTYCVCQQLPKDFKVIYGLERVVLLKWMMFN